MLNGIVQTKRCSRCKIEKSAAIEFFNKQTRGKLGLHSNCRECERARSHEYYARCGRERVARYRAMIRAGGKYEKVIPTERMCPGCERTLPLTSEHFHRNRQDWCGYLFRCKECERRLGKEWRDANPEKRRAAVKRAQRKRYANPMQRLSMLMSNSVAASLPRGAKRRRRWEACVGYSVEQLREHLAKQFKKGMSFDNYGEWHVDHIVPVKCFNFTSFDDPDFKACWALTNLRPLWEEENLRKQGTRTHLI